MRTTPRATARTRRSNLGVAVGSPNENPPTTQVSECSLLALFVAQRPLSITGERRPTTPSRMPSKKTPLGHDPGEFSPSEQSRQWILPPVRPEQSGLANS